MLVFGDVPDNQPTQPTLSNPKQPVFYSMFTQVVVLTIEMCYLLICSRACVEQWSRGDMLILYPANQPNPTNQRTQPTNCGGPLWSQPFRISHDSTSLQVREGEGLSGFLWPGVDEIVVVVVVVVVVGLVVGLVVPSGSLVARVFDHVLPIVNACFCA